MCSEGKAILEPIFDQVLQALINTLGPQCFVLPGVLDRWKRVSRHDCCYTLWNPEADWAPRARRAWGSQDRPWHLWLNPGGRCVSLSGERRILLNLLLIWIVLYFTEAILDILVSGIQETEVLLELLRKLGAWPVIVTYLKGEHLLLHILTLYTGQIIKGELVRVHCAAILS